MLSIAHAATGAFLAHHIPQPALSSPLIVGMHYLGDWIPHWDVGTGLTTGKRTKVTAFLLELVDLAVAVGLVYFVFQRGVETIQWHIWLGAGLGILPDLLDAPKTLLGMSLGPLEPLHRFHERFHESIPNIFWGLVPQTVVVASIIWLVLG